MLLHKETVTHQVGQETCNRKKTVPPPSCDNYLNTHYNFLSPVRIKIIKGKHAPSCAVGDEK